MKITRELCALLGLAQSVFAVSETVDLSYTKYKGKKTDQGVTTWYGMRYAAPPVGKLRFAPPADPRKNETTQSAIEHGKVCLATGADPKDPETSEDCLFIDVTAPTKATTKSKLPVLFYIQGGGFNSNSNPNINSTGFVKAADMGVVVVSFNYRVGPWGFLTNGDEITPNNGLWDQRKALEWVQKNIEKFGGDPKHVVIGGNSAGGASVQIHLTAQNGTDHKLFVGAYSGSPSYATMYTAKESQYQYNQLVTRIGCAGKKSLECLRNKNATEIQSVNFNIPLTNAANPPLFQWLPVIDGDFLNDYAYRSFREGKFIKVPTIWGDDNNGGTVFVPRNTSTLAESNQFLIDQYPTMTPEQLGEVNDLYPNQNKTCPERGCYWRQASDAYQDARYMCPAIFMAAAMRKVDDTPTWNYLWDVKDPKQEASGVGVPHTVEVKAMFAPGYPETPESYEPGEKNAPAVDVWQGYLTSFVRSLDPNKYKVKGSAKWDKWDAKKQERMAVRTKGKTEMVSIGQLKKRCEYWGKIGLEMLL